MAEETKNTTVYFGGLVLECTNEDLSALLEGYNATEINVMLGRNGQSRGYALVTFATEDAASNAIVGINGVDFQGLKLELRMARLADGTDESGAEAAPAETAPAEAAPAEAAPAEAAYFVGDRANWSKTPFQVALNYGRDADAHNTRTRIRITPDAEFLLTTTTEKDGTETTIQKVKGTSIWPGSGLTLTIMVENVSGEGGNGGVDCKVGDEIVATIKEEIVCNKNEDVPACLDQPNLADQQMTFGVGCSLERCLNVEGGECYFPIKAEE